MRVICPHDELLALPRDVQIKAKAESNWRIPGYHLYEPAAAALFELPALKAVCSALFNQPAVPRYSLTFSKGSQQGLHQDMSAFHVWPRNFLVGAWIACEDISAQCGPLVYYPGSHRSPMFPGFDNYPQTQRRTADPAQAAQYDAFVHKLADDYPRKEFVTRKGSVLFWHGMLIHGGAPVIDPASTRKSFVIHYMPDGVDRSGEVVGPFNW
jgi:ectoine hydroxylase-related dioxygenase (phytanoyl-CoA dioxygenase family)